MPVVLSELPAGLFQLQSAATLPEIENVHACPKPLRLDLFPIQESRQRSHRSRPHFRSLPEEIGARPEPGRFFQKSGRMLTLGDIHVLAQAQLMRRDHRPVSEDIESFADNTHVHVQASELVRH